MGLRLTTVALALAPLIFSAVATAAPRPHEVVVCEGEEPGASCALPRPCLPDEEPCRVAIDVPGRCDRYEVPPDAAPTAIFPALVCIAESTTPPPPRDAGVPTAAWVGIAIGLLAMAFALKRWLS